MNRKEWRERKFKLRSVSTEPHRYWWEKRLELASREQLEGYIQLLLAHVRDLEARLIGTLTDDEIRKMVYWKYGWIGSHNGDIARIIFEIVCSIRNRLVLPESQAVVLLREQLDSAERRAEYLAKQLDESEAHKEVVKHIEMFRRICVIHREDVRKRKEVRRFRLVNFSIAELEAELQRRKRRAHDKRGN